MHYNVYFNQDDTDLYLPLRATRAADAPMLVFIYVQKCVWHLGDCESVDSSGSVYGESRGCGGVVDS